MIERIRKKYAMTEKGAKDYVAAVFWSVLVNISKMLPVGVLATALSGIVEALTNGTDPRAGLTRFLVAGILALAALFVTFLIQYKALYEATYRESANRRIRLAEVLRQLPLSFFGNRDLTDLTTTIMGDTETLEKAFSHFYREKEDVLRDVSFTAKQGQVTALVGPSGGGKSTAAKLAARFWDPAEGTVRLGGVDVSTVDGEALLKNYAIVFQDVVLFADTVMENIRLGKRDATDEEVLAAAKAAQCDAFVSRLPEGYHTLIGENGSRLSGGERQRISIARAILKDAPVILLDEATASLDVENETAVQAALSGLIKDKTVLIIAHRMRTVMNADQIVLLSGGRVVEMGSPAELLKKNGLFRHMAQLQSESMEWTA